MLKFYINLEDSRFAYVKEWLEHDYEYTENLKEADFVILGIHQKEIFNLHKDTLVFSFHPLDHTNYINLNENESFLLKNAKLTALGIVSLYNFENKKVVIFGNGRIATFLKDLIEDSIVVCRHPKLNERSFEFMDYANVDYIINTIPHQLNINYNLIRNDTKLIDVASSPHGFDKNKFINIDFVPGIPGKVFPKEAALLIYKEVIKCLKG